MTHELLWEPASFDARDPVEALAALTGRPDGPPVAPPEGVRERLDALSGALSDWSSAAGSGITVRWERLLLDRAHVLGLRRSGRTSANRTCRLLPARDAWVACNLSRPDDVALVGPLTGQPVSDPWPAVRDAVASGTADDFVGRARALGLPAARLSTPWVVERQCGLAPCDPSGGKCASPSRLQPPRAAWPWQTTQRWERARRALRDVIVVDLSSMWAGPLAAHLLMEAGATVIKVESTARPDGARGAPGFYRLLHPDRQASVSLDFGSDDGRHRLRSLIESADVVVEASRPRALEQLGCGPFQVAPRAGRVWLSITGYGRSAPGRNWVAFGDDAAVAGGLVGWEAPGLPVFLADAIADPVTGITAAVAAFQSLAAGGGVLVDVPMALCAAWVAGHRAPSQG